MLKHVVRHYIESGTPVGSRVLTRQLPIEWSPATVRNIMADLEEQGFLGHPHKSAGRVPTDKGYRAYVDDLLELENLTPEERGAIARAVTQINAKIMRITEGVDEVLYYTSRVLARISNELGIILSPRFNTGLLEKLQLVPVTSDRIVIELSLRSGFVKTVLLETQARLSHEYLREINQILNERLGGLSIADIRQTIEQRLQDLSYRFAEDQRRFIRVFVRLADSLFNFDTAHLLNYSGTNNILTKPDFVDQQDVQTIFQMLEEKSDFVDKLLGRLSSKGVEVTIGNENGFDVANISIVTANYRIGDVYGVVGVMGPRRMPYSRIIPLVQHTASVLDKTLNPA